MNEVMDETLALKVIPVSGALLKILSVMEKQSPGRRETVKSSGLLKISG